MKKDTTPRLDESMERTLPHNLEAERSVLGAVLVHNDAFEQASTILKADDFFRDAHRRIYAAIQQLIDERRVDVDYVTLKEELARRGDLEEVGGPAYIASLSDGVPRATNVQYYAGIVKEKATLRALIYAANKILTDAYAAEEPASALLERADRLMLDVESGTAHGRLTTIGESFNALFADFERRIEHRGQLSGIDTGFKSVNDLTFGWQPGDLVVVAARPSMGKTTLVMNSAIAGARTGKRVVFFSMEMRKRQLEYRIVSSLSGVPCTRLVSGYIGQPEYPKISQAFETLHTLPIAIDDRAWQSVHDIRRACRRLKTDGGLDLVVIDYVQLMPGTLNRKGATRNEELTDVSRRLKTLADEIAAPIILISQLRRLDGRRRPQLDDLRESGALEQDSDIVAFLHRGDHRSGGLTEFILAKQRNGPTGTVKLTHDRDTLTFADAGLDAGEAETPAPEEQPEMPGFQGRRHRRRA